MVLIKMTNEKPVNCYKCKTNPSTIRILGFSNGDAIYFCKECYKKLKDLVYGWIIGKKLVE